MRFGVFLPQSNWVASGAAIRDTAQAAEDLGFHAVSVHDHIQYNGWFLASGSREPVAGGDIRDLYDAVATLAFVAGITRRVRLHTSILLVPIREPILTANQLASIDRMSDGRLTVGIGVGPPLKESAGETTRLAHHRSNAAIEYAAFGVTGNRGPLTDEYVEAMVAIWTQDPASYHGEHVTFDDLEVHPKPMQQPHIPIWVGGRSELALQRVVKLGQTWNPSQISPDQFRDSWRWLDEHFVAAGRTPANERAINTYSVIADDSADADALAATTVGEMFYNQPDFHARTLVGNPDRWHERLTEWRSLGLTYCELKPIYRTVDELIAQMRMVSEEIMPAFQDPPRA
jgi:alkanesulfonate monooxygenase SsuD/methylene tetrahydromethanopterin reductase-like flavin-dependent oxidoreductase (luciferase family)